MKHVYVSNNVMTYYETEISVHGVRSAGVLVYGLHRALVRRYPGLSMN
jgi:hypothetical protein